MMHKSQMVTDFPINFSELSETYYGLGWGIQWYRGHRMITHDGGIDGFYTKIKLFPDNDFGMIACVNLPGNQVIDAVSYYISDKFLNLDPIDWTSRLKSPKSDEDETPEDEAEEVRVKGTKPSHKLEAYAGKYDHPGYGVANIELRDKQLYATMNQIESQLEHWHYDVFMAKEDVWDKTKIQFLTNKKGDIDRLAVQVELELDDVIFEKQPDAHLYDPEFLSKLVGEYVLEGVTSKIYFKDDTTLGLTVPGQPPYTLVPYRGTEFNIEGLNGFSLRFDVDGDDEIAESVTFIQPNGVFTAERK
jgi:hypothetical protein